MKKNTLYLLGGLGVLGYVVYKKFPDLLKRSEESAIGGMISGFNNAIPSIPSFNIPNFFNPQPAINAIQYGLGTLFPAQTTSIQTFKPVTTTPTSSTALSVSYGSATINKIPTLSSIPTTSVWGQIASGSNIPTLSSIPTTSVWGQIASNQPIGLKSSPSLSNSSNMSSAGRAIVASTTAKAPAPVSVSTSSLKLGTILGSNASVTRYQANNKQGYVDIPKK